MSCAGDDGHSYSEDGFLADPPPPQVDNKCRYSAHPIANTSFSTQSVLELAWGRLDQMLNKKIGTVVASFSKIATVSSPFPLI